MSSMFNSIAKGLVEAVEFEQGKISARKNTAKVTPPLEFSAADIKEISPQCRIDADDVCRRNIDE